MMIEIFGTSAEEPPARTDTLKVTRMQMNQWYVDGQFTGFAISFGDSHETIARPF